MNFERWKGLRDYRHPPACMDWRHVCMVNAMLEVCRPRSVVEIGCWRGFSTAAIIEAHEKAPFERVDLVDLYIREDLKRNAGSIDGFHLTQISSDDFAGKPECWLIDGNHEMQAFADYSAALAARAKIIILHDTMGGKHPLLPYNRGSGIIAEFMRRNAVGWFEDAKERKGERTHRGLMFGFFYRPDEATVQQLGTRLTYLAGDEFAAPEWKLDGEDGSMRGEPVDEVGAPAQ